MRECRFQVEELPPLKELFEEHYMPARLLPDTTLFRLTVECGEDVHHTRWADHTPIPAGLAELKSWMLGLADRI